MNLTHVPTFSREFQWLFNKETQLQCWEPLQPTVLTNYYPLHGLLLCTLVCLFACVVFLRAFIVIVYNFWPFVYYYNCTIVISWLWGGLLCFFTAFIPLYTHL